MILAQKTAPKVPRWPSDGNFLQGHPIPTFSKKVQSGDQEKFFKNRPKSCPRLKGSKALCRKRHYPVISIHLKCNDRKRLRRKQQLQKCQDGQVMAIFCKVTQNQHFLKKCKGKTKRNCSNSPKKLPSFERLKSTLAQMALSSH